MAAESGVIDNGYKPSDDEPFMNERQREYFRRKLLQWKDEILRESRETLNALQTENENHPDIADRASSVDLRRGRGFRCSPALPWAAPVE